jgi:protein SCO1/2
MNYPFKSKEIECFQRGLSRMACKRILFFAIISIFIFAGITFSGNQEHQPHDNQPHDMENMDTRPSHPRMFAPENGPAAAPGEVGVSEKIGQFIPADIRFSDENGHPLILGNFIDRPTLILPIFYHCPRICSLLLANLANALNGVTFTPGSEYRVLAASFNEEETPDDAKDAKKNYLQLLGKDFPETEWKFLTGDLKNIRSLTDAIGFKFKKIDSRSFVHPNVLVSVAANGKIIRYLYGPDFLPFDISMAIAEAEKGTPGISIKKLVSYCFSYDPASKRYVFKLFRVSAIVILSLLAVFIFFLLRKKGPTTEKVE